MEKDQVIQRNPADTSSSTCTNGQRRSFPSDAESTRNETVSSTTSEQPSKNRNNTTRVPALLLPPSSEDLLSPAKTALQAAVFFANLVTFMPLLRLSPFLFEDFLAALEDEDQNEMISQIHMALLTTLMSFDKKRGLEYGPPELGDSIKSYFFFADSLTWPECLKAYLASDLKSNRFPLRVFVNHPDYPIFAKDKSSLAEKRLLVMGWLMKQLLASDGVQSNATLKQTSSKDQSCRVCRLAGGPLKTCSKCRGSFHINCLEKTSIVTEQPKFKCKFCQKTMIPGFSEGLKTNKFLGNDRNGTKYWVLCRRIFAQTLSKEVFYYSSFLQLKELLGELDPSFYERELHSELKRRISTLERQMKLTETITNNRRGSRNIRTYLGEENRIVRMELRENEEIASRTHQSLRDQDRSPDSCHPLRTPAPNTVQASMEHLQNGSASAKQTFKSRPTASKKRPNYNFYKLGQDGNFRSYKNLYAKSSITLTLAKFQEKTSESLEISKRFSLSKLSPLFWNGMSHFSRDGLLNCVVNSIVLLEKSVPKYLMGREWKQVRKSWVEKLRESTSAKEFAHLLKTLILHANPEMLDSLWADFVGHTTLLKVDRVGHRLNIYNVGVEDPFSKYAKVDNQLILRATTNGTAPKKTYVPKGWIWKSKNRQAVLKSAKELGFQSGNHSVCVIHHDPTSEFTKHLILSHEAYKEIIEEKKYLKVIKNISYKLPELPQQHSGVIQVEQDLGSFKRRAFVKIGTTSVFFDNLLHAMEKKRMACKRFHDSDESDSPGGNLFKMQCNLPKKSFKKAITGHSKASLFKLEKQKLKRLARREGRSKVHGFDYNLEGVSERNVDSRPFLTPLFHTACLSRLDSCSSLQGVAHHVKIFLAAFTCDQENRVPFGVTKSSEVHQSPQKLSDFAGLSSPTIESDSDSLHEAQSSEENQKSLNLADLISPNPPARNPNEERDSNPTLARKSLSSDFNSLSPIIKNLAVGHDLETLGRTKTSEVNQRSPKESYSVTSFPHVGIPAEEEGEHSNIESDDSYAEQLQDFHDSQFPQSPVHWQPDIENEKESQKQRLQDYEEPVCSGHSPPKMRLEFSQYGTKKQIATNVKGNLKPSTSKHTSPPRIGSRKTTRNDFAIKHPLPPRSPNGSEDDTQEELDSSPVPSKKSKVQDENDTDVSYEVMDSSPILTGSHSEKFKPQDFNIPLLDERKLLETSQGFGHLSISTTEQAHGTSSNFESPQNGFLSRKAKPISVVCLVTGDLGDFPEECKLKITDGRIWILTQSSDYQKEANLVSIIRRILNYETVMEKLTKRSKSNPNLCHVFITFKPSSYSKALSCREGIIFVKQRKLGKEGLRLGAPYTRNLQVMIETPNSESDDESDDGTSGSILLDEEDSSAELASVLSTTPTECRVSQDYSHYKNLQENKVHTLKAPTEHRISQDYPFSRNLQENEAHTLTAPTERRVSQDSSYPRKLQENEAHTLTAPTERRVSQDSSYSRKLQENEAHTLTSPTERRISQDYPYSRKLQENKAHTLTSPTERRISQDYPYSRKLQENLAHTLKAPTEHRISQDYPFSRNLQENKAHTLTAPTERRVSQDSSDSRKLQENEAHTLTAPTECRVSQEYSYSRKLQGNEAYVVTSNRDKMVLKNKQNERKSSSEPGPSKKSFEVCDMDDESVSDLDESESKRLPLSTEGDDVPKQKKKGCYCGVPFDENRYHLGCSTCDRWLHPHCIGMPNREAAQLHYFLCQECQIMRMEY